MCPNDPGFYQPCHTVTKSHCSWWFHYVHMNFIEDLLCGFYICTDYNNQNGEILSGDHVAGFISHEVFVTKRRNVLMMLMKCTVIVIIITIIHQSVQMV